MTNLVAAFSEDQVETITGVTKSQLRYWDKTAFFSPTESDIYRGQSFGRIYSFRDLTSLKVLNELRNDAGVPLQRLRELKSKWDEESDDVWRNFTYRAVNKRVYIDSVDDLEDALTGQKIFRVDINKEYEEIKDSVSRLFERDQNTIGKVWRQYRVVGRKPVVAGTRIKVDSIRAFASVGYTLEQILEEYPDLTMEDVKAAIEFKETA